MALPSMLCHPLPYSPRVRPWPSPLSPPSSPPLVRVASRAPCPRGPAGDDDSLVPDTWDDGAAEPEVAMDATLAAAANAEKGREEDEEL